MLQIKTIYVKDIRTKSKFRGPNPEAYYNSLAELCYFTYYRVNFSYQKTTATYHMDITDEVCSTYVLSKNRKMLRIII
jgi:hypothetical protein